MVGNSVSAHSSGQESGRPDFRYVGYAGQHPDNRWNSADEPTLYLAGDPGILIAEWWRHFPSVFDEDLLPVAVERSVFRLQQVVDLRDPAAVRHVSDSSWFLDRDLARAVAHPARAIGTLQAMIVPSVAFLDDLSRWNLVVFLEVLPTDTSTWITWTESVGPLRWR